MLGKGSSIYKTWEYEWAKMNNVPENLDVINLGSTGDANNFDYSLWKENGCNLACSPQDMYYDNQILKQYYKKLSQNAVVIICLSEFALVVDRYTDGCQSLKYYGFLDSSRIINYSKLKKSIIKIAPGLLYPKLIRDEVKQILKKILRKTKKADVSSEIIKKRSIAAMDGWLKEFGWNKEARLSQEQRNALERSWSILQDDIKFCYEKDLIPSIVIPPFNKYLMELMPAELIEECLWSYVRKLEHMGIRIISFWNDKELQNEKYYETAIKLNSDGKRIFNQKVRTQIFNMKG